MPRTSGAAISGAAACFSFALSAKCAEIEDLKRKLAEYQKGN